MLFARLIESQRAAMATQAMVEGAVISATAHAILIVGWVALHRPLPPTATPEATFSPVEYLIPRDRLPGLRPQRETVTWTTLAAESGAGYEAPKEAPRDERELEIVVPKGKEAEPEAAAEAFETRPPIALGDSIKTELEVDSAVVRYENGAAPSYPESLLRRHVEGVVLVQYVVDTLGRADTSTFRVISATHSEFVRAVRTTLPLMRFRPAMMANRLVPQLVQQPFAFKIIDTTKAPSRPPPLGFRGRS